MKVWKVNNREQVFEFEGPSHLINDIISSPIISDMSFSPNGELFACRLPRGTVFLFSTTNWKLLHTWVIRTLKYFDQPFAFSPSSNILAVTEGSEHCDNKILLIDVKTGAICSRFEEKYQFNIRDLAFSFDGTLLASCSDNHVVCIWDVKTGKCMYTLADHTDRIKGIVWGPDNLFASCSFDGTAILYDLNPPRLSTAQMLLALKMAHAPQIHSAEQKARLVEILQTLGPEHADIRATLLEKINYYSPSR